MTTESNETTRVLVLRDVQGTFYALSEATIRTCRATPDQQQAIRHAMGGQEVVGYDGGSLVALGAITIAPQTNLNIGLNLAVANFAPVTQVLGQTGLNAFSFHA